MKSFKFVFIIISIVLVLFAGSCATKKKAFREVSSGTSAPVGNTTQAVKPPASVSGAEEFLYEFDVMVDVDPQKMAEPRPDYPEPQPSSSKMNEGSPLEPQPSSSRMNEGSPLEPQPSSSKMNEGSPLADVSLSQSRSNDMYGQQSQQSEILQQQSQLSQLDSEEFDPEGLSSAGTPAAASNVAANTGSAGLDSAGTGTVNNSSQAGNAGVGGIPSGNANDYASEYAAGFKAGFADGTAAGNVAANTNSAGASGFSSAGLSSEGTPAAGSLAGNQNSAVLANRSAAYVEGYNDGSDVAGRMAGSSTAGTSTIGGAGVNTGSSSAAGNNSTAGSSAFSGMGSTGTSGEAGRGTSSTASSNYSAAARDARAFGSPGGPGGKERRNTNLVGAGSVNVEGVMDYIKIKNRNPGFNEEHARKIINSYIDEAVKEDVNYDFAIAQMLYWTAFLTHKQRVDSNNLGGLDTTNTWRGTFRTTEEGVKAHIQHLRGYSHGTLKYPNENVDPRWDQISHFRGTIKNFEQIYPRWSQNTARYRRNIILILNDMHRYSDRYSSLYR